MADSLVYVSLQQSDLHCISAFESIKHSLDFKALKSLRRYRLLNISVDGASQVQADGAAAAFISAAFDIVNPNKESVAFELPKLNENRDEVVLGLEVMATDAHMRQVEVPSMVRFPDIRSVDQRLYWVLHLDTTGSDPESVISDAIRVCGPTVSRAQGLLVNPLFESYLFQRLS